MNGDGLKLTFVVFSHRVYIVLSIVQRKVQSRVRSNKFLLLIYFSNQLFFLASAPADSMVAMAEMHESLLLSMRSQVLSFLQSKIATSADGEFHPSIFGSGHMFKQARWFYPLTRLTA